MQKLGKFCRFAFATGSALTISGCSLLENEISCSSSKSEELVKSIVAESNISQSFMFPFIQSLQAQRPEDASLDNDENYQRLIVAKSALENDLRTAVDACFNEENHPEEFREGGMNQDKICNANPSAKTPISVESFLEDTSEDNYAIEAVVKRNNEAKYYFKYASLKVYPIKKQLSEIENEMESYKASFDTKREEINKKHMQTWSTKKDSIEFTLNNIIMTNKNENTGSVECKAELDASLDDLSSKTPIKYTIEKNSEGELFGTVWGL